ncbi:MAG: 5'-methylthioadenosine/S-adenosylhomocysteine nucleosidase [Deltaproteobacteria bacterium]|nr:MAG: 5'-methylthioadenosine/S-adenosylhomocysteine nucleosidase [Deltaproteobacteria bacterium]
MPKPKALRFWAPRRHLVRYAEIFGSASKARAKLRALVPVTDDDTAHAAGPGPPHPVVLRGRRLPWADLLRRVFPGAAAAGIRVTHTMTHADTIPSTDLLLLVAEHEWDGCRLAASGSDLYAILAEGTPAPVDLSVYGAGVSMRFTLKYTPLVTIAARVPIGLVGTGLLTAALLEALTPSIVVQVGFGGILSDDLMIGDVAVASQVDCYLTKDKVASSEFGSTGIGFAGEVFRPSHSLVQIAQNLKYAHPSSYAALQVEARRSLERAKLSHDIQPYMRSQKAVEEDGEFSTVHIVHFACGEVVSTTADAVAWLRSRDRKLAIIDMESGGALAAVWEYCHRHARHVETAVIRGCGGYGDDRHDDVIANNASAIHRLAFENACHLLCRVLGARQGPAEQTDLAPPHIGILVPLEEEFSYFFELLTSAPFSVPVRSERRSGRYYYFFDMNGIRCVATIVGDMGLVKMALATEDLRRTLRPFAIVVLGIAAGFSGDDGDVKICDVAIARSVDLYLHRARNRMGSSALNPSGEGRHPPLLVEMQDDPPIEASTELVDFILRDARFAAERDAWRKSCAAEMDIMLAPYRGDAGFDNTASGISLQPELFGVRLASGEPLAAAGEFVSALKARGCCAADMEAGGAAVAYQWMSNTPSEMPAPMLLILRGISDRGDDNKATVQRIGKPGMFRRGCVRNASRLLFFLLTNEAFAALLVPAGPEHEVRPRPG